MAISLWSVTSDRIEVEPADYVAV